MDLGANEVSPFPSWRAGNFPPAPLADAAISGSTADADPDGLKNLLEYTFAGNPLPSSRAPAAGNWSRGKFALPFLRIAAAADLDRRVQISANLKSWKDGPLYSAAREITANESGSEIGRVAAGGGKLIASGSTAKFMRVSRTLK